MLLAIQFMFADLKRSTLLRQFLALPGGKTEPLSNLKPAPGWAKFWPSTSDPFRQQQGPQDPSWAACLSGTARQLPSARRRCRARVFELLPGQATAALQSRDPHSTKPRPRRLEAGQ